jgi:hypothetical protein
MHPDEWKADLATFELDRFFVFRKCDGWLGRWLSSNGPEVDDEILTFLNTCSVVGAGGKLGMNAGTLNNPIAHGALYTGLHLETEKPEDLVALCAKQMSDFDPAVSLPPSAASLGSCQPSCLPAQHHPIRKGC